MKRDFRTIFEPKPASIKLSHQSKIYLSGSCFAENIGKKIKELKFPVLINPFGISYNPTSIHQSICLNIASKVESKASEGIHFSYDLHSELNSNSEQNFRINIQQAIDNQHNFLKTQGTIILSYGTAWVYEEKATGKIANNCHKQPPKLFTKRLLSVKEITDSWKVAKKYLDENYPCKNYIFTISPVRHLKNGFRENQLSKSILHLAVEEICNDESKCHYFPAYELLQDDLRDYRFYKEDMLHPNETAVEYIWESFAESYFSKGTRLINQQIEKFNTSLQHRAFQPDSAKHQKFLLNLKSKIKAFQMANDLDLQTEIDFLKQQIL
tara:strand:- start:31019 stop:31993 length:975 start_codon:yes stop_codon:yes gene_type:complete